MNSNLDPEKEGILLDTVLRDEEWQAANGELKTAALAAFHQRQQGRRWARAVGAMVVLAVASALAFHWSGRRAEVPLQVVARPGQVPKNSAEVRYLSDEELLALFPKGSCVLAEVDGRKELVFLDPKLERTYLARAGEPER
jgi:hypothetical protein